MLYAIRVSQPRGRPMSDITAPPYATMPLEDLKAELGAWDRMLVRSLMWERVCFELIRDCRDKCAEWLDRREREARQVVADETAEARRVA